MAELFYVRAPSEHRVQILGSPSAGRFPFTPRRACLRMDSMKRRARMSLRVSLAAALIGTVILTSLLLGGFVFALWRDSLRTDLSRKLSQLAGISALLIEPAAHASLRESADMESETYRALREKLRAVRAINPEIRYLYTFRWAAGEPHPRFVLDTGEPGEDFSPLGTEYEDTTPTLEASFRAPYGVRVEEEFAADEFGTWLSAFAPVLAADGSLEAVVGLDVDAGSVVAAERRLLLLVAELTGLIVAAMGAGSWWFARRIARPLQALSRDMDRIRQFQLDGEPEVDSRISEIITMERSLANMKKGLRSFRKYVPADLVADLISLNREAVLGTEKREVTVFFCDLQDFTAAGEALSSEDLNRLLSDYFETVTRTLQEHGATIDKFIGDAVMAFWGAPRPAGEHALAGARASMALLGRLDALRARWSDSGLPPLYTRIGLNSGAVLVGNVGHAERLSYTVLGDAVNLASRLESLNKYYGTRVLVGEETLRSGARALPWRPVDRVAVKGKTKGTLIGELAAAPPDWWADYRRAWEAYRASEWRPAAALFDRVREAAGEDGPSRVLSERCRRFLAQGVPADWKGVWVMHDK